MKTVQIPTNWTPEQADCVYRFLQSLQESIWLAYSDEIQRCYRDISDMTNKNEPQMGGGDDFDDDIPF